MSATSQVPAFIDALVSMIESAVSPVKVYDGPPVTDAFPQKFVGIGWDGNPDPNASSGQAADAQHSWAALGALQREEDASVTCSLAVWSGDTQVRARRVAAYDLLAQIEAALVSDPTVGGTVRAALLHTHTLIQEQTEHGNQVRITFAITYGVRLT